MKKKKHKTYCYVYNLKQSGFLMQMLEMDFKRSQGNNMCWQVAESSDKSLESLTSQTQYMYHMLLTKFMSEMIHMMRKTRKECLWFYNASEYDN